MDSGAQHSVVMENELFQSSFLRSPAYLLWALVGKQHGLHTNEDIACYLLKYYQDTSKLFPTGLTRCETCGNHLGVTCTFCDWTIHVKMCGSPSGQTSRSSAPQKSSLELGVDCAVTKVKEERDKDDDDEEGVAYGSPCSDSSGLLPERKTLTMKEIKNGPVDMEKNGVEKADEDNVGNTMVEQRQLNQEIGTRRSKRFKRWRELSPHPNRHHILSSFSESCKNLPPPPLCSQEGKRKRKNRSECNKDYRRRLLADPIKALAYKQKNRERTNKYRENATPEQKKRMNELAKLRNRKCRGKQEEEDGKLQATNEERRERREAAKS